MHILIVTDQHPESLGGVQVAIRMQRRALERLGHRVTVAAPALHRLGYSTAEPDRDAYIDLPSRPITRDREYSLTWPGRGADRRLANALAARPPVDLVHVQGDFWGAMNGVRAARGLRVPIVHTMHNHVDEGTRAVTPLAPLAFAGLRAWRRLVLGRPRGGVDPASRGAWRYLAELAADADTVTAPSQHFAEALRRHGVSSTVLVTPNGVDDEAVAAAREVPRSERTRPKLVWLGRMSHEKRVLEFIDAIALSGIDADIALHGAGLLLPRVEERIAALGLADRVTIPGPVPYPAALAALRDADALVQTSIGFETQGLTPFEAAALGTPTIFSDAEIADDVDVDQKWVVADGSVAALARALREAAAELAAAPGVRRVDASAATRFLQSARSGEMLAVYESVLSAARSA
ncbi:glycosyltransferase [Leucobacter manosquensis]|uniref:D-inositol 3-phosphate glycosyltransferase n=1 Tax=Leucobacter manosquensis TaxID=2810611 RepID=A0ABS5M6Z7_9MICO|nr:glycosyltransferase [Leucobacter manosquensis]